MKQRKFKLSPEAVVEFEKREHETREALELRRLQAVGLYGSGADMAVVQQISRASRRTIQRWVDRDEATGLDGLKAGWKGGNHRGLSAAQRTALKNQLQNQRPNQGLATGEEAREDRCWTVADIRELVEKHYGVHYRSRLHDAGWRRLGAAAGVDADRAARASAG